MKSGVVPQPQSHTPSSVAAATPNPSGMPKTRESVKFNVERPSRIMQPNEFLEKHGKQRIKESEISARDFVESFHNESYRESFSASETEVESFIDDCGDQSDFEDDDDDIQASIATLQKGLANLGNRVRKFRSQADLTATKQRRRESPKQAAQKTIRQRNHCRNCRGEGDVVQPKRGDDVFTKLEGMKRECYEKIEAQMKVLMSCDKLANDIYHNHLNHKY